MTTKKKAVDVVRGAIEHLIQTRNEIKVMAKSVETSQPEIIASMQEVDPENYGIVIDPNDSRGTAYVQQNEGSTVWDEEKVLDYVKKKQLWMKSSSRVLDLNKFEALVASKEVPPKVARRLQMQLKDPKPFIRMGKKGENSL